MGPLLPLLMAAGPLIGKIFGGAAKGSADQRYAENNQALANANQQNQLALALAQLKSSDAMQRAQMQNSYNLSGANVDMARKQFLQNEPSVQARQAMIGSLLNRIQPASLSGLSDRVQIPNLQNSIISALGPEARQAGALLAQRGVTGLQNPTQFDALPALSMPKPLEVPAMQQAQLQKSGLLEKILGGAGLVGSTIGAIGDLGALGRNSGYEPNDINGFG